ncbi:MAG: hypothetical protein PHI85_10600 [Victivallaceae bacterium]|nr:hypothetical protein [Victivallaceae bacterium]
MSSGIFLAAHCGDTLDIPLSIRAGGRAVGLEHYEVQLAVGKNVYSGELSTDGRQRLIRLDRNATSAAGVGSHAVLLTVSGPEYHQTVAGFLNVSAPEDDVAPSFPVARIEIENPINEIAIQTAALVNINQFPQECRDRLDQVESAAAASQTAAGISAGRAAASETSAAASAVAAAASEVNAAASADNAQNARLLRYEPEVANLKYSAALGYYAELTSVNDTVKAVYNVADCSAVALHLKSANAAVTGNVSLEVGGHTFAAAVGASGAWIELALDGGFSGLLTVKLLSGLTDSGNPVAVIVDGVRVSCDYRAAAYGRQSRQVAAKPLLYSDALGYYLALDASYGINLVYPVNGITAVALKLKSANSAVTGNAALTVTVGTTAKTAVVAVGASDAWTLITLDAPSSGAVAIVRDTASADDTLKDSGTVVAAIAADINYYYQEV